MRILILALAYVPDGGPGAPLYQMLCENLAALGHEVTVISAVPHYPSGRVPLGYRKEWIQRGRENGVNVIRVRVPSLDRSRLHYRMLQFVAYQIGATWAGLREEYDVVFIGGHALNQSLNVAFLSRLRRKPMIFSVHDMYPYVGVQLGIFRNRLVVRAVAALQAFCLNSADYVRVLSEAFSPTVRSFRVSEEKIALIYDWVDTDFIRPLPRQNAFSEEHGLNDYFVVLYAGNIGLSQGLDKMLEVARNLSSRDDLRFVFVGEGTGREQLIAQAEEMRLTNVKFIPFQPRERVPEVLATADISFISLQPGMGGESLPSKSFSTLASGRPILAAIDEGSPTWNLVERARAGLCVPPGDSKRLTEALVAMISAPEHLEAMRTAGRAYAEMYHSHRQAARDVEKLLEQAISSRSKIRQ